MRIETIFGAVHEFWWDSQGRMRMWQGYSRRSQRVPEHNVSAIIISTLENHRHPHGVSLSYAYRYPDDPDYYDDEHNETDVIQRAYINGEEVMIS